MSHGKHREISRPAAGGGCRLSGPPVAAAVAAALVVALPAIAAGGVTAFVALVAVTLVVALVVRAAARMPVGSARRAATGWVAAAGVALAVVGTAHIALPPPSGDAAGPPPGADLPPAAAAAPFVDLHGARADPATLRLARLVSAVAGSLTEGAEGGRPVPASLVLTADDRLVADDGATVARLPPGTTIDYRTSPDRSAFSLHVVEGARSMVYSTETGLVQPDANWAPLGGAHG